MKYVLTFLLLGLTDNSYACYGHNYKCKQFLENLFKNTDIQFNNELAIDSNYQASSSENMITTKNGAQVRTIYENKGNTRFPASIEVVNGSDKKIVRFNHDASGNCSMGEVHENGKIIFKSDAVCNSLIELQNKGIAISANPIRVAEIFRANGIKRSELIFRGSRMLADEGVRILQNCKNLAAYQRPRARPQTSSGDTSAVE